MSFLFRKIPKKIIHFQFSNLEEMISKNPLAWEEMENDIPPAGGLVYKEQWDNDEQLAVLIEAPDSSVEEISAVVKLHGFVIESIRIENVFEKQWGPTFSHFSTYKSL
jgi:hypothetical protein